MTLAQLEKRFEQEGIDSGLYTLGRRAYDGVCLMLTAGSWAVFYSERGRDEAPMFVGDEAAACQYYYEFVLRQRYRCCVATRDEVADAEAVRDQLRQQGTPAEVTHVRCSAEQWEHQVCVMVPDEAAARRALGLPAREVLPPAAAARPTWWQQLRQWLGG